MVTIDRGLPSSGPGRRERKKHDVRERLYEAALRLFRTRGYDATTVQAIADAADTAKGTFFNYFPTKEHVLARYHDRMAGDVLESVRDRRYPTALEALQDVLVECAAYAVNDPVIGRVLLRVMFSGDVLMDADRHSEERLREYLESCVARGLASGELRPDLDAGLYLSLLVGTLSSSVTEWVLGEQAFDLERSLRRKIDLVHQGASARPADPRSPHDSAAAVPSSRRPRPRSGPRSRPRRTEDTP